MLFCESSSGYEATLITQAHAQRRPIARINTRSPRLFVGSSDATPYPQNKGLKTQQGSRKSLPPRFTLLTQTRPNHTTHFEVDRIIFDTQGSPLRGQP